MRPSGSVNDAVEHAVAGRAEDCRGLGGKVLRVSATRSRLARLASRQGRLRTSAEWRLTCWKRALDIEALLIPVDQFPDRRRQVAIGGDDRHELADIEPPRQREIATDRVEQEGRHLCQQVVEELDREFAAIEPVADAEQRSSRSATTFRSAAGVP